MKKCHNKLMYEYAMDSCVYSNSYASNLNCFVCSFVATLNEKRNKKKTKQNINYYRKTLLFMYHICVKGKGACFNNFIYFSLLNIIFVSIAS